MGEEPDTITAENAGNQPRIAGDRRSELQAELAHKVAFSIGTAEIRATDVPGLTLFRHTLPTAPAAVNYEPSVALVVRGSKQVDLGANTFL